MIVGERVSVKLYGGETAYRRILAIREKTIVVCAEEEYERAHLVGEMPSGLGFPKEDILESAS